MSSKYNGWTNWDTWNIHLHITNDELSYYNGTEAAQGTDDHWETWIKNYVGLINLVHHEGIDFAQVNKDEIREALLEE